MAFLGTTNTFALKLSTKFQENNFILWNHHVGSVILSHKLHKVVVNPQIPLIFKTESDHIDNIMCEGYESWIVQDQSFLAWLLLMISKLVLPRLLSCNHAYEVWDKVHKHFNSQMKASVHQLREELKMIKKGIRSNSEYVLHVCAIIYLIMAIGDPILECD